MTNACSSCWSRTATSMTPWASGMPHTIAAAGNQDGALAGDQAPGTRPAPPPFRVPDEMIDQAQRPRARVGLQRQGGRASSARRSSRSPPIRSPAACLASRWAAFPPSVPRGTSPSPPATRTSRKSASPANPRPTCSSVDGTPEGRDQLEARLRGRHLVGPHAASAGPLRQGAGEARADAQVETRGTHPRAARAHLLVRLLHAERFETPRRASPK